MNLETIHETLQRAVDFLGRLLTALEQATTTATLRADIDAAAQIAKVLQNTLTSYQRAIAQSDAVWSRDEGLEYVQGIVQRLNQAIDIGLESTDLSEAERVQARYRIVDTLHAQVEQFNAEHGNYIKTRRASGIAATDPPLLTRPE
jgi:hypothetical protein